MPDMSFSTFSDEDSNVEIIINETDKEMVSSSYTKDCLLYTSIKKK